MVLTLKVYKDEYDVNFINRIKVNKNIKVVCDNIKTMEIQAEEILLNFIMDLMYTEYQSERFYKIQSEYKQRYRNIKK